MSVVGHVRVSAARRVNEPSLHPSWAKSWEQGHAVLRFLDLQVPYSASFLQRAGCSASLLAAVWLGMVIRSARQEKWLVTSHSPFRDLCYWPASKSCRYVLPIYNFLPSIPAPHLLKQGWIELIALQAVQTRRESKGMLVLFFKILLVLSPAEYEALQVPAAVFVNITPEEITKKMEDKR